MENRLHYLGKCKPKELKLYFDKVYDFYKAEALKKGYTDNEIVFQEERKWVKVYVKVEMEI